VSVTDSKHAPPARNGKSAFSQQNVTRRQEIWATPALARDLKSLSIENMETMVSVVASIPASLTEATQPEAAPEQVGGRARAVLVKVPSWFTAAAALRVAQLKSADHLLVLDRGRVLGALSRAELAGTPPTRPLGRCLPLSSPIIASETPVGDALRLMDSLDLDCLVVTAGPMLVGLVTRSDLADHDQRAAG